MTLADSARIFAKRLAEKRRTISRFRHAEGPVRIFALDVGPSTLVPPQPPHWCHLVMLRSGIATAVCNNVRTIVTPNVALWVPSGTPYVLALRTRCELRILYASPERYGARAGGPLTPSALLHELVERAMVCGYLDPQRDRDARLLAVIDDELSALSMGPNANALVLPRNALIRAAVERDAALPEERPRIAALADAAGMSERSFVRHFVRETGLPPREWLRRARLGAAMIALASGASVTEAGLACGYSSISAFITAYRTVYGITPGRVNPFALRAARLPIQPRSNLRRDRSTRQR